MQYMVIALLSLLLILGGVTSWGLSQYKKVAVLEKEISINKAVVESQNEAISKLELDSKKYRDEVSKINQNISSKYDKVVINNTDSKCEVKLLQVESLLKTFSK